jgi:hypothetical protein
MKESLNNPTVAPGSFTVEPPGVLPIARMEKIKTETKKDENEKTIPAPAGDSITGN